MHQSEQQHGIAVEGENLSTMAPTYVRYRVLAMLCLLTFILYLDRICIAQAAVPIQKELGFDNTSMGYVLAAFLVAYGLFEVPTGHWSDRHGSRGVLTRIVLWWSFFTMLTGIAWGFTSLVTIRFLFGAGEAGALPNAARVVARWFPPASLGRAQGSIIAMMLVGGAVAPIVSQSLITHLGWRWAFFILGTPGVIWAIEFFFWFRDDPAEHPQVNEAELRMINAGRLVENAAESHPSVPWRCVLTSANIWLLGAVIACAAATTYLIFSWYPTYLQKGRGVSADVAALMASMVLAGGAAGSTLGGWFSDFLVRAMGSRRWARSLLGALSMASAGLALIGSVRCDGPWIAATGCAWACFAIHVQLAAWWGVVADISGRHLGALFGLVNSMGVPAGVASQILLGRSVDRLGALGRVGRAQWDPAFYVYGGLLILGGFLWLLIDATKSAVEPRNVPA